MDFDQNLVIIFSLISLGFFGGFSHCIGMCGPFVVTQVTNSMQSTPIKGYNELKKLQNLALLPYQLGRITTYSFLGLLCGFFGEKISDFIFFKYLSAALMIVAAFVFSSYLLNIKVPKYINQILPKANFVTAISRPLTRFIKYLFQNPLNWRGFLLGIILGFIPCGMLYSALALAISIGSWQLSALGMLLFGLTTFPALFIAGCSGYFFINYANFKLISKVVMFINILLLLSFALKIVLN